MLYGHGSIQTCKRSSYHQGSYTHLSAHCQEHKYTEQDRYAFDVDFNNDPLHHDNTINGQRSLSRALEGRRTQSWAVLTTCRLYLK